MPPDRDLLIGGKETPAASGRTTADVSPWTGEPYARVAAAGPEDVHAAVDAADAAFAGWAALEPLARRNIFLRAADLMEERGQQVVELMAREVGGTRGWALFNVEVAAGMLREAAAAITAPRGDVLTTRKPGGLSLAVREPLGVVAAFAPWNAPVILGTRAVAAPLAAGSRGSRPAPPAFFRTASGSVGAPGEVVVRPEHVRFLDYAIELGPVLGAPLPVGTAVEEQDLDRTPRRHDRPPGAGAAPAGPLPAPRPRRPAADRRPRCGTALKVPPQQSRGTSVTVSRTADSAPLSPPDRR